MRSSQLKTWSVAILESYERDLMTAMAQGRNLLAEKYAYMMEQTSPLAFARLRDQLPIVSEETMEQIQAIVKINLNWEREAHNA